MKSVDSYSRSSQAGGQIKCPSNHRKFTLPVSGYAIVAVREHEILKEQRCLADRSHVYNARRSRSFQERNKPLSEEIRSEVVHRETKFIAVLAELPIGRVFPKAYPCVVHEHIEPVDTGYHLPGQVVHFAQRGKICPHKLY